VNTLACVTVLASWMLLCACSSDDSTSGAGGPATSGGGGSTSTTGAAGAAGGGTGGLGGTGGGSDCSTLPAADCQGCCGAAHPAAYDVFRGYHRQDCACDDPQLPCHTACTRGTDVCANPDTPNEACTDCLVTEGAKGAGSACTLASAQTCQGDPACAPFISCALGC